MFDASKAFEVSEDGIKIEGGPHIIGGSLSPIAQSLNPTSPSVYIQSNGDIFTHDGIGGPWQKISAGGAYNFSFYKINEEVVIPDNQQMIVEGGMELTPNGQLEIAPEGQLIMKLGD